MNTIRRSLALLGFLAGLNLFTPTHVWPQVSTATISGTARDSSGAMLPGAEVVVRNVETGISRSAVTDAAGRFRIPQLGLGSFEVRASLTGFKTDVRSGIVLTVGREAVLDLTLQVGDVAETVEVTGEAPLVETTSAAVSGLVSDQQIRELPLNGRSLEQLAVLQLGVTISRNAGVGFFSGNVQRINIAGARTSSNSFLLDGSDINDFWNNTPGSVAGVSLGVDTIREFKVLVNNYSAEYGRAGGGVITSVSRSGTNQLHGSVFEFLRNSALDARNFFDRDARNPLERSSPAPFRRNQFGFTVGGPIRQDKAFFFGSYEGLRQRLATTSYNRVPTVETRATAIATVAPYLAFVPLPTPGADRFSDGTQDYVSAISNPTREDYFMMRLDHRFSESDSMFGRYTVDDAEVGNPNSTETFASPALSRNQYFTFEETHVFTPIWLNVFRGGVNRSVGRSECESLVDFPSTLDLIPGRAFGESGGMTLSAGVAGLPGMINCRTAPHNNWYNLYEASNDMTFIRSAHSLKTGMIVKNIRANKQSDNSYSGTYEFATLANFLAGRPLLFESETLSVDSFRSWRQTLYGFYVQDEWKAGPRLALNLGLRYEFVTAPTEANGKAAMLLDILDADTTVFGKKPFLPNVSKKNFSPRIGFAYDVFGNGHTAVRGGFGLYYDQILPVTYSQPAIRNRPFFSRVLIDTPPYPNASALLANATPSLVGANNIMVTDNPYLMQYNFSIQQQFAGSWVLNVGYIGSRGVHLTSVRDGNSAFPDIQPDGRKFFPAGRSRRNPNFAEISNYQTDADSRYHGLVIGLNQRFKNGLQLQVSYTYAKLLDNSSALYAPESSGAGGRTSGDPDDLRPDWGLSAQHVGQNFVSNSTYILPFGAGNSGWREQVISGWQLNGIVTLSAGVPRNVQLSFDRTRTLGNGFTPRPDLVPGASTNPVEGSSAGCPGLSAADRSLKLGTPDLYMDPCAFSLQDAGYFGNLGRNTVIGPGLVSVDMSLAKNFKLPWENGNLQFRSEIFNVINRANFGAPLSNVFSNATIAPGNTRPSVRSDFGLIRDTRTTNRQIQFALKLTF
jgi:hypothetical protein